MERNDWVLNINEALASSKQSEEDENSDPEDDLPDEKARLSASQNSTIFAYMKERQEDLARKRKRGRHRLLALSAKRTKGDSGGNSSIQETDEKTPRGLKFVLHALQLKFHLRGCINESGGEQTNLEPFFVTFALYDAKERKKISADFHAQLNHKSVKESDQKTRRYYLIKNY